MDHPTEPQLPSFAALVANVSQRYVSLADAFYAHFPYAIMPADPQPPEDLLQPREPPVWVVGTPPPVDPQPAVACSVIQFAPSQVSPPIRDAPTAKQQQQSPPAIDANHNFIVPLPPSTRVFSAAKRPTKCRPSRSAKAVHKCAHCPASFNTLFKLYNHERTHDATIPYRCDVCGKAFTRQSNLRRHLKIHGRPEFRFKCDACHAGFGQQATLMHHRSQYAQSTCETCAVPLARRACLGAQPFCTACTVTALTAVEAAVTAERMVGARPAAGGDEKTV